MKFFWIKKRAMNFIYTCFIQIGKKYSTLKIYKKKFTTNIHFLWDKNQFEGKDNFVSFFYYFFFECENQPNFFFDSFFHHSLIFLSWSSPWKLVLSSFRRRLRLLPLLLLRHCSWWPKRSEIAYLQSIKPKSRISGGVDSWVTLPCQPQASPHSPNSPSFDFLRSTRTYSGETWLIA